MKEQKRLKVEVVVYDYRSKVLSDGEVTLKPLGEKQGKIISLKFDKQLQAYLISDVSPGRYLLQAKAKGFESDQREVQVDPADFKDIFILGKKGMPFYYRSKVKVPFEPPSDLLAISVKPGISDKGEEELLAYVRGIKLQPEEISKPIREDNVRVLCFPPRISEQEKQKIQQQLSEHQLVRLVGPVIRNDKESISFLTNELIVKFKSNITKEEVPKIAKRYNFDVIRTIPYAGNTFLLRANAIASYGLLKTCAEIVESNLVEYAQPNLFTTAVDDFLPNDFLYTQQPHHQIINSEDAWEITMGDNNIIIAVVDSGCDFDHPDFTNDPALGWDKVYRPFDFINMDNDPTDGVHGTKSSGIATAIAQNNEGVVGVAPGCRLMPIRRPSGGTDINHADMYVWIAGFYPGWTDDGVNYDVGTVFPANAYPGADVISNSFGYSDIVIAGIMKDALDFITTYGRGGKGCIVLFSVGNGNTDFTTYRQWAAYEKTIAVASSAISPPDASEVKVSNSNYGSTVDVCAPGGGHSGSVESRSLSTTNVGSGDTAGSPGALSLDYDDFGQTSCACPQVAGVAALVLSTNPDLTWVEVRHIIRDTAVQIDAGNTDPIGQWIGGYSQWYGHGRIDAEQAVIAARDYAHDQDIVVRDYLADDGTVPSGDAFWDSPDIWVRNTDPAVDGDAALPPSYDDAPPHQYPIPEQDNWVHVRFKNVGTADSLDFCIRVYLTHFAGTEFVYPSNYIPTTHPSDPIPVPLVQGTYLIGEVHYSALAAGASDIVNVLWPWELIPPKTVMVGGVEVTWHPCLLVEVSPHDSPVALPILEALTHVWDSNDLAQKNISIVYPDDDGTFATAAVMGNLANRSPYLELQIDRSYVPPQVQLYLELLDQKAKEWLQKFVQERKPEVVPGCCRLTFLEETRLLIDCPSVQGNGQLVLSLPAKAKLEMTGAGISPDDARYNFTLGNYKGREVIWLASRGQTRIPVFAYGGRLIPVIVGGVVEKGVRPGNYEIKLTQFNSDGQPSGGIAVQLKIGK